MLRRLQVPFFESLVWLELILVYQAIGKHSNYEANEPVKHLNILEYS